MDVGPWKLKIGRDALLLVVRVGDSPCKVMASRTDLAFNSEL